jgi:membrane protein
MQRGIAPVRAGGRGWLRRTGAVVKTTAVRFYNDQMTQHAAALTYYGLMSLFPALLLGLSLLGLLGEYPSTYNAIMDYLRDVAPASALAPLDESLRRALQSKGTAATTLAISAAVALYGTTGVLESARRALNVVFDVPGSRSFLRRKTVDVIFTIVLMAMALFTLIAVFVGGSFAKDLFGFLGLGPTVADIWDVARWPVAVAVAMLVFALVYWVTPDVRHHSFRWITPGAVVGVVVWLLASYAFARYISEVANVGAIYGAFAGAIVLVAWLWLSSVALLLGAELNAAIESEREVVVEAPEVETVGVSAPG